MSPLVILFLQILGVLVIVSLIFLLSFGVWRSTKIKRLQHEGLIVDTALGPVEYWVQGSGPTIVISHGGPGGYDQGKLLTDLADAGFQITSFSRPGYLQTPLIHESIEEQADLLNAFLDSLEISQIVMMGFSAGGPIALAFANKYPAKTRGLILEAALSREYVPPDSVEGTIWERIFLKSSIQDLMSYLMVVSLKLMPFYTLKSILPLESTLTKPEITRFITYVKQHPEALQWYKDLLDSTTPLSIRNPGLQNDLKQYKTLSPMDCSHISCPTLIIHSRQDNDAKWKHAEHTIKSIPHAQLLETFGGHLMWVGPDANCIRSTRIEFLTKLS